MGRRKLLSIFVLLSVLLIIPLALSLGFVDVSRFLLPSTPAQVESSSSSTATVFVDPAAISDETLQSGSYFTVHVNISDVTDLFTWHVNISWNPAILNFSRVKEYGPLLRGTTSPNGTSGWIDRDPAKNVTIAPFNNTLGFAAIAETILDSRLDATGVNGSGRVVSVEFLVVGYGSTNLTISLTGNLATTLLNSTGGTITYDTSDGYFRNKYPGDVDGDKYVGSADFSILAGAYGSSKGQPAYEREADFELDGYVGSADFSVLAGNYGRTFP